MPKKSHALDFLDKWHDGGFDLACRQQTVFKLRNLTIVNLTEALTEKDGSGTRM